MIGDVFDIKPHYFDLTRELLDILFRRFHISEKQKFVIGVGGESGCGKSMTAKCLEIELNRNGLPSALLHLDDYFRLPPHDNHANRLRDLSCVGPGEVRMDLLQEHVHFFLEGGEKTEGPLVDYPNNKILSQTHDFSGIQVLIVEGTYVLSLSDLDCKIFMKRGYPDTIQNRDVRNRDQREPVIDQILQLEQEIIRKHAILADIMIDKDYKVLNTTTLKA